MGVLGTLVRVIKDRDEMVFYAASFEHWANKGFALRAQVVGGYMPSSRRVENFKGEGAVER